MAPKVLLIDDFYGDFEDGLKARFGPDNVSCLRYPNAREALRMVRAEGINAVLLDVQFVRDEHDNEVKAANVGPDVLRAIKRARPDLPVHILTSFARTLRPDEILELEPADGRTQKPHPEASEQTYIDFYDTLFREVSFSVRLAGVTDWDAEMGFVVGKSQTMVAVAHKILRWVHLGERFFLVTGEYGTGKEQVGKALHRLFGYSDCGDSYQALLCSAVSPRDFRINLGGFPKQAGSDAARGHLAPLEALEWQGTLLFDQIDDLAQESQLVLNRMLEGQGFPQENNPGKVFFPECKVVFTAQLPPEQLQERMRGDAFQRCFRNYVHVPPLRERKDAIPALFEGFVRSATLGRHFDSFLRDDVKEKLLSYDFPGNVRELKNILERAVAETRNSPLQAEDIHFPKAASGNRLTTPDEQRVADAETDKLYEDYIRVKAAFDGYPEYPGDYDEGRLKGRTFTIDECRFPELVTQSIFRREPRIDGRTLAYIYGLSEGVERQRLRKYKLKLPDRQ